MKKTILILLCSLVCCTALATDLCRPSISDSQKNYLIGYGSLLQARSRQRTNPHAKQVFPIEVKGFERVWGIQGNHYHTTCLTLIRQPKQKLNAAYYPVNEDQLSATDHRESGYCRVRVLPKNIQPLALNYLPKGNYFIYTQRHHHIERPSKSHPIVQSYVDIFLSGCMEIATTYHLHNFPTQCILQTHGWPTEHQKRLWINDRIYPRRPFDTPHAMAIDRLLSKHFNDYFDHPIE